MQKPTKREITKEGEPSEPAPVLNNTDFPPALQRTLERKLREEEEGDGSTLTEPELREALRKVAQRQQCD